MKNPYSILIRPIFTEDSVMRSEGENPQYTFRVHVDSNKLEIKKAIEDSFNVKVVSVNTINMMGKKRRVRYKEGKRSDWKKAIVTLEKGQTIELA